MAESCFVCGNAIDEDDRLVLVVVVVLVLGKVHQAHCSESCLRENLRKQRIARAAKRRRWFLGSSLIALLLASAGTLWQRYRAPQPESIASGPPEPEVRSEAAPPEPIFFGPAWPPTDADWIAAFDKATWTYPLPGPSRRTSAIDSRIFGPEPPKNYPALCRKEGHCGVDLGGELWGEHVYAVHDGVVDRVQRVGSEERGGQHVRLSHFGGMVFTQYFHLAATPRLLVRGARVKAGDVIGLLGDTGIKISRRHLHFALSIRPSSAFSEVYWDPTPLMAEWPLRMPTHGTVAGLASAQKEGETPRRRRSK